jgi:hypothetical protein
MSGLGTAGADRSRKLASPLMALVNRWRRRPPFIALQRWRSAARRLGRTSPDNRPASASSPTLPEVERPDKASTGEERIADAHSSRSVFNFTLHAPFSRGPRKDMCLLQAATET